MKLINILSLACFFSLVSCSNNTQHKMGLLSTGPNEYEVTTNKPLELPPHYDIGLKGTNNKSANTDNRKPLNKAEEDLLNKVAK